VYLNVEMVPWELEGTGRMRIHTTALAAGMAASSLVLAAGLTIDGVSAAPSPPVGEPTPPQVNLPPPPNGSAPEGPAAAEVCVWSKLDHPGREPPHAFPPPVIVDCDRLPDLEPVDPPEPEILFVR
jgi:hypothetical protein